MPHQDVDIKVILTPKSGIAGDFSWKTWGWNHSFLPVRPVTLKE